MGWNVREVKAAHNRWLTAYDASMARTMNDIGASAVHFARTDSTLQVRGGGYRSGWVRRYRHGAKKITVSLLGLRRHNLFHEVGTGIYGPQKRRITPRNKQFLAWKDYDSGRWCFARSVKGVKPTWNGRRSATKAFLYGRGKLLREAERLAAKF